MNENKVIPFRKFKIAKVPESQFVASNTVKNRAWAEEDLAKSGLTLEFMFADVSGGIKMPDKSLAAYTIPYFFPDGTPILDQSTQLPLMFRTRLRYPDFSREQRYIQPSGDQLAKYGLPPFVPYIHPLSVDIPGNEVICAEGEKKAASILHYLGIPAFGIGGCQLWRNPDGSGSVHPWIVSYLRQRGDGVTVTIVPDGDVFRYDICNAYGTYARALENEGFTVRILNPGDKIDDLLVRWGDARNASFAALPSIAITDLVQSPASLIKKYGLSFKENSKGVPLVHQHTSNVMRLLDEHPAFPKLWRNLDTARVMVGNEPAESGLTEMDLANYFQHNLGFDKVNSKTMFTCIDALARRNSKSPFLDYIRSLTWDGTERLETWMIDLWGVQDSAYSREVSSKWLVSSCARLEKPGTKIDWMLIVVGPQKTGKTTMPSILFKEQNLTLYGEHQDKDLHMLMHSALCVGFDELDSFGKREASNLKAMITRNEDAFRPPYGASVEVFPRRFTIYGCGNRHEFLQHDPSGYRRYPVIEVTRLLDFAGLEASRDQLWAEAYHRYSLGGVTYWEVDGASEIAKKYAISSPLEDKINEFLTTESVKKQSAGGPIYFTLGNLLAYLDIRSAGANSSTVRDITGILHAMGILKPEKNSRHPGTGAQGKWYIHTPS